MGRNAQGLGNVTGAEHDNVPARFLNEPALVQKFRRDLFIRLEMLIQRFQANLNPFFLEDVGEAALGQPAMQRHLPTFKPDLR